MVGPPSSNGFVRGFFRWTKATRSTDRPNSCLTSFKPALSPRCMAYATDAAMNGLAFPRHEEETAVATFAGSIREAARTHVEDPMLWPLIPNWNRVESALPEFLDALNQAVAQDNSDAESTI